MKSFSKKAALKKNNSFWRYCKINMCNSKYLILLGDFIFHINQWKLFFSAQMPVFASVFGIKDINKLLQKNFNQIKCPHQSTRKNKQQKFEYCRAILENGPIERLE